MVAGLNKNYGSLKEKFSWTKKKRAGEKSGRW